MISIVIQVEQTLVVAINRTLTKEGFMATIAVGHIVMIANFNWV